MSNSLRWLRIQTYVLSQSWNGWKGCRPLRGEKMLFTSDEWVLRRIDER